MKSEGANSNFQIRFSCVMLESSRVRFEFEREIFPQCLP